LGKFRDNFGKRREQRLGEDIMNVAVSYSVQEDDTERGKLRFEREQEWGEWIVA
jgi:hypothetical protein